MPSQDITLLLYPVISSRGDYNFTILQVYNFLIKVNDATISILIRGVQELNSQKD